MLEGAFSFRGRIGRLRYFLGILMMIPGAIVAFIIVAALVAGSAKGVATIIVLVLFGGLIVIAALWYSLSLQVRRIRDLGWDPVVVLVGWFAVKFGDIILAKLAPSLAVGGHHTGTFINSAINLGLSLALLFGRGRDDNAKIADVFSGPDVGAARGSSRLDKLVGADAGFESPVPAVATPVRLPGGAPQGFGRRGLR